jgi:hypothetical protein
MNENQVPRFILHLTCDEIPQRQPRRTRLRYSSRQFVQTIIQTITDKTIDEPSILPIFHYIRTSTKKSPSARLCPSTRNAPSMPSSPDSQMTHLSLSSSAVFVEPTSSHSLTKSVNKFSLSFDGCWTVLDKTGRTPSWRIVRITCGQCYFSWHDQGQWRGHDWEWSAILERVDKHKRIVHDVEYVTRKVKESADRLFVESGE